MKDKVIDIVSYISGVDESVITEKSHLYNDLGMDSLDSVEMEMEAERKFDISIPINKTGTYKTVQDFIDVLKERGVK